MPDQKEKPDDGWDAKLPDTVTLEWSSGHRWTVAVSDLQASMTKLSGLHNATHAMAHFMMAMEAVVRGLPTEDELKERIRQRGSSKCRCADALKMIPGVALWASPDAFYVLRGDVKRFARYVSDWTMEQPQEDRRVCINQMGMACGRPDCEVLFLWPNYHSRSVMRRKQNDPDRVQLPDAD